MREELWNIRYYTACVYPSKKTVEKLKSFSLIKGLRGTFVIIFIFIRDLCPESSDPPVSLLQLLAQIM